MPFDKSGKWTPFSAPPTGQQQKTFLEGNFGIPALPEQETPAPEPQPEQTPIPFWRQALGAVNRFGEEVMKGAHLDNAVKTYGQLHGWQEPSPEYQADMNIPAAEKAGQVGQFVGQSLPWVGAALVPELLGVKAAGTGLSLISNLAKKGAVTGLGHAAYETIMAPQEEKPTITDVNKDILAAMGFEFGARTAGQLLPKNLPRIVSSPSKAATGAVTGTGATYPLLEPEERQNMKEQLIKSGATIAAADLIINMFGGRGAFIPVGRPVRGRTVPPTVRELVDTTAKQSAQLPPTEMERFLKAPPRSRGEKLESISSKTPMQGQNTTGGPKTYREVQSAIDNYEDALIKKYGESEVLGAPVPGLIGAFKGVSPRRNPITGKETKLTDDELGQLKEMYHQRDEIGANEDKAVLDSAMSRMPKDGPATPDMVKETLQKLMKDKQLVDIFGHTKPDNLQETVNKIYVSLSHKLAAKGELPEAFAGDLDLALSVARDFHSSAYGKSPEPLLRQVKGIVDVLFGTGASEKTGLSKLITGGGVLESIETKQPWQMTREEWTQGRLNEYEGELNREKRLLTKNKEDPDSTRGRHIRNLELAVGTLKSGAPLETVNKQAVDYWSGHKNAIDLALSKGKPVPPEVLKDYPDLKPKDIQTTRAEIQSMDDVLKVNETPEGPIMLYSGIPAEKIAESVQKAAIKLQDALGIPEKGGKVEIVQRAEAQQPGLLTPFKSPSRVAQKYPEIKPYVESGNKATEVQERLRNVFNKRFAEIDKTLGGSSTIPITKPLEKVKAIAGVKSYKENKSALQEILLTGDMMGKKFTAAELRSEFGANDAVIRAYNLTRSAYDHAHTIASSVRELRGKTPVNYREGYIPHFFHSWFIVADGQVVGSAKTLREAVSISNPVVREKGIDIKIVPKTFEFPGADVQAAVLGDMKYFKLKSKVEKEFGISAADAQALLEGVARMKGRSRFVGNFLQRKGVQGWEKNLDWVNRHYFNMISRYAALDQFKSKAITQFERTFGSFDKDHTGTAKYIKDYINDINGNPTAVEELLNNSLAKVPGFSKFLGTFLGDRPSLQLASMTTNAVAIAKLGLYNVSSAMVNATQLINSYAKLGEKWTAQGLKMATRLTPTDRGILKQIGVDTQLGLESGAGYSKAGQMGKLFQNSLVLFKGVDTFLRRTSGLGAYHKAISEGKTRQQALEYAKQIIDQTQFNYSIAEAPAFIRRSGPVGQVLFQFKKYPIKQLEFITQLKGAENVRFWIPFALISGYYAMPGFELLKSSVKSMFNVDIDLEVKKHLMDWASDDPTKQKIAKTIMYGITSNAGVDISRRIGAGDYVPSQGRDFMGPTVSTVVNAAQLAAKKEWVEMLRAISPAAGNLALMLETDGKISDPWNRGRLKAKLKPEEKAMKALGFTTSGEAIERDKSKAIVYSEQRRKESEQKAIDGFIKTVQSKDRAAALNQVKALEKMGITPQRVMDEMKKKKMLPTQRAITNVPKKEVKEYIDIYKFK